MTSSAKYHIYHAVVCLTALLGLAACDMPTRPEGIDIEGMTQIAGKLHAEGDDAGAANFYQRALQRVPSDAGARQALAEIFETHGDLESAAVQYRDGLALNPDNTNLLLGYGRVLLKLGQPGMAKDQYERIRRNDSDNVKALNGLGVALDQLDNHSGAQQAYQEALTQAPDDKTTLANLGHSYVLTGAYEQAIHLLEPYARDKKASPTLRQNLAEAYGMAGMEVDAERMGRMDLSDAQVKYNLGYYRRQRAKLALVPALYADLGQFPTEAVAQAHVDEVMSTFAKETESLVLSIQPQIKGSGGTPSFAVTAIGFAKAEKLRAFCEHLKKARMACKAHGD